jgi:threonine dehydrogenase-like Zn-dependent dehydrogenase
VLIGDIYAPRKIRLIEHAPPQLGASDDAPPDQIVFEPELACLCGSDLLHFEGDYPEYAPAIGQSLHEMIGRVAATNGQRFQAGDRVLCVPVHHFGLAQRFMVSERRAIPLDPRLPDDQAVVAQPLGTVIFALRKIPYLLDQNVVVVGQGPIGQLFCATLRNLGARQIIAIDVLADRLEVSRRMGATSVIDASRQDPLEEVKRHTGGQLADLVVEAVGHREHTLNLCADLCRPAGRILSFGVPPERIDGLCWRNVFLKNLTVHTSVGPDFERDFPLALRWLAERRIDVRPIITHRFPLSEIQQAFELFAERRDGALKVFVEFPAHAD